MWVRQCQGTHRVTSPMLPSPSVKWEVDDHRARRGPGCRKNPNNQTENQTHGLLLRLFLSMSVVGVKESYFGRDVVGATHGRGNLRSKARPEENKIY